MTIWIHRALISLSLLLTVPALLGAQTLHGYPGKAAYASPAEWPFIDGQCHWVPGDGSPTVDPPNTLTHNIAHAHVGLKAPVWSEAGLMPITVADTLKLFHADGGTYGLGAVMQGGANALGIDVQMNPFPLVGDPAGLVVATGSTSDRTPGPTSRTSTNSTRNSRCRCTRSSIQRPQR